MNRSLKAIPASHDSRPIRRVLS